MHRALVGLAVMLAMGATPSPTPPPQIYHIVTRPLCSELHGHIAPAVGMMLQNDATIKKSPDLFKQYNTAALYGSGGSAADRNPASGDPGGTSNPSQQLALQGMENLIRPIANNIIAIETMLDSPTLLNGTGQPDDDKQLQDIRAKLLKALAAQNASLDIISGFVDTQQMADLQHADEGFISSLNKPDINDPGTSTPAPALNPLEANPNYAGLPPNPYDIDLATLPGLTLGYNPVTRLLEALRWTIDATATRENDAAKAVMSSASLCSSYLPHPSPTP
ncbi:MAG: hypothetical protein WA431_00395 [Candidatus Cybelea sp.]